MKTMDKELFEIQEKIKEYVNKHDVNEFNVYIMKLWNKKNVVLKVK